MARITRTSTYKTKKEYHIFIILHPITNEYYIHFSTASSLRTIYKTHYTLQNPLTKKMFQEYRYTLYPPEMYSLEMAFCTQPEAYAKQLVWIKYFIEKQYHPLNHRDDLEASNDLFAENTEYLEKIKQHPVSFYINSETRLFANYGRERRDLEPTKKKQINFQTSQIEYEQIQKNAQLHNKKVSAYLREVALTGHVIEFNFQAIIEHTKQISLIKNEMNAYINTLVKTNQAYPVDVQNMILLLKEINESEKKMLKKINNEQLSLMKKIKKMILTKSKKSTTPNKK